MATITSKINDGYSATIYPEVEYGRGNGYYFHYTSEKENAIEPSKVPLSIHNELIPQINAIWKGDQR